MYAESLLEIAMIHLDPLIDKAKTGDQYAFEKLVNLWYRRIYNFGYKYFGDHDLAMEVAQKTFITTHKKISSLKETKKFKQWLYKIASNYCHEEERKRKREQFNISNDYKESDNQRIESEFNPDKKLQQAELSEILLMALNEINQDQRTVVIMKEYEGLKFHEIAEILEISENTVKSRMYYGLGALKKILDKNNINKNTVYYEL